MTVKPASRTRAYQGNFIFTSRRLVGLVWKRYMPLCSRTSTDAMPFGESAQPLTVSGPLMVSSPCGESTTPKERPKGHEKLEHLVRMAMVNGDVPPESMPNLLKAAEEMGMSGWDVRSVINWIHSHG